MKFLSFGALQGFSGMQGLPLFLPVFGFRDMTDFFTGNRDPIPPGGPISLFQVLANLNTSHPLKLPFSEFANGT